MVACGGGAASVGTVTSGPSDAGDDAKESGTGDGGASADGSASADGTTGDSGSGDDANTGDDANASDGATQDASGDADDGSVTDGATGDGGDAQPGDGGVTDGAGDATSDGASDGATDAADSGVGPCGIGNDTREIEPNNVVGSATQMPAFVAGVTAICGNLAAGGDADFVQFKVPPTASHLYWEYTVNVTPVFYVDGVVNDMKFLQTAKPYVVQLVAAPGYTPPLGWTFKVDIN